MHETKEKKSYTVFWILGSVIVCILLLQLISYVNRRYVPNPLMAQRKIAISKFLFFQDIPKQDIEILRVELQSTHYFPWAHRDFKIYYKTKGSDEIRWVANIGVDNRGFNGQ